MNRLVIKELKPAELPSLYGLLKLHQPTMSKAQFSARLKEMKQAGYRAIALFEGKNMLACSGFWLRTRFWCGRQLDIDNFVVHPDHRRKQLGVKMLDWFETFAKAEKIELMVLDTYADYFLAQRFYVRNGFAHTGYHMTKIPGTMKPFTRKT
jgi:ribosomal protein S18 acetylase RimI-like enzyme